MSISDIRKHFQNKLKERDGNYTVGECYDMDVQKQLTELVNKKQFGARKVFYLECQSAKDGEIQIALVSESVFIDEPKYL